jgi:Zn-dependent protease with chaperone function
MAPPRRHWLVRFLNQFRLAFRLLFDRRVSVWLKLFLVGAPLLYFVIPLPDDILPFLGILDDVIFITLCVLVFNVLAPDSAKEKYCRELKGTRLLDLYRYPSEGRDLALGFGVTFGLLALLGYLAGMLAIFFFVIGYFSARFMRSSMLANALHVNERQLPHLFALLQKAQTHLPPLRVHLLVIQNPMLNAFAFGFEEPYTIVLTSDLVERLTPQEIQAVIAHELGHIHFGHVRLTSLMGGMSGLFSLLRLLFFQWQRSCEYSADAVALLATDGDLEAVVSMMLKLASGLTRHDLDVQAFLDQLEQDGAQDAGMAEKMSTHPFIVNRVRRLMSMTGKAPSKPS